MRFGVYFERILNGYFHVGIITLTSCTHILGGGGGSGAYAIAPLRKF